MTPLQTQRWIRCLYRIPGCAGRASRCPICGSLPDRVEFQAPYSALDHCGTCDHVYSRRTPGRLILHLMYRDIGYWIGDKGHQGITGIEPGAQWRQYLDARLGALQRAGLSGDRPQKLFEIGCAEGMLLHELGRLGHEARGCECNRATAEAGITALGVKIEIGLFDDLALPRGYFDVVASFHTIEHIPGLDRSFARICEILDPEGALLIEVPTGPAEYGNTDHVHFFSETSLRRLMEKYFEIGDVVCNRYSNAEGSNLGSLYGIGRRPRKRVG